MAGVDQEIQVVYKPMSVLMRAQKNPKSHDLEALEKSIRRFGFVQPLAEDARTGTLVAGHGRLEALLKMQAAGEPPPKRIKVAPDGSWMVPVLVGVAFDNEREAEAFLLADNRLVEAGGWDTEQLTAMLTDLHSAEALEGVGWSDDEVQMMIADSQQTFERGPTPEEREVSYVAGVIKQIVLYFKSDEFERVLERLDTVMQDMGVDNHTAAMLGLLKHYEATRSTAAAN